MRRALTITLTALAVLVGLAAAVVAAWTVDMRRHENRVARNVRLAGTEVGGVDRAELGAAVRQVAARYEDATVHVHAPKGGFTTDTAALGLTVREDATVREALRIGRTGSLAARIGGWATSFVRPRRAGVEIATVEPRVHAVVRQKDPGPKTAPVEPNVKVEGGRLVPVAGKPGSGVDPRDVLEALPHAARSGGPIRVEVERGEVRPRFTEADAKRVADEGERLVRNALAVTAGTASAKIPPSTLRSWVRARPADEGLALDLDAKEALRDLATLLPKAGQPPGDAAFTVEGETVRLVPAKAGTGCCADGAVGAVLGALRTRPKDPLNLPLRRVDADLTTDEAAALGIKERVATFSTKHKGGEPRVANIHRIADTVRGTVIPPGTTFSINDKVGRRTREKGYVSAPVIENGMLAEDVGGGISQFATTLFNAAFFAGLEFGEYQSHSLYISRYPYGREATMGFPRPDLEIKNTTPYGILIWPRYSATEIAVDLYSTTHVEATQTGQTKAPRGPCTRVSTERTRKYTDGSTKVDHVYALYRPAEGVNCP